MLIREIVDGGCRRSFFLDLRSPPGAHQRRFGRGWWENFLLQTGMAHHSGYQDQAVRAFGGDAVFKTVLARPLRHAAGKIHFAAADLPTFVSKFDDDPHRTGTDDAPLAFGDVGNLYYLAIDQRGHRTNPYGVSDAINVAPQRRLPVVDVFRRAKHFQIEARAALAI